jgi:hypothetical protein
MMALICNALSFIENRNQSIWTDFRECFRHAEHLNNLEISIHRKLKLTYKYFFEGADVCLLVKYQHGLFIFNGINGSK